MNHQPLTKAESLFAKLRQPVQKMVAPCDLLNGLGDAIENILETSAKLKALNAVLEILPQKMSEAGKSKIDKDRFGLCASYFIELANDLREDLRMPGDVTLLDVALQDTFINTPVSNNEAFYNDCTIPGGSSHPMAYAMLATHQRINNPANAKDTLRMGINEHGREAIQEAMESISAKEHRKKVNPVAKITALARGNRITTK